MSVLARAACVNRHSDGFCLGRDSRGRIYLHGNLDVQPGGTDGTIAEGVSLERYDPSTNAWTTLAPHPSRNISYGCCYVDSSDRFVIATGHANQATNITFYSALLEIWAYDPGTDSWAQWTSMPANLARAEAHFWNIGNTLYVAGGQGQSAFSSFIPGNSSNGNLVLFTDTWTFSGGPGGTWTNLGATMNYQHLKERACYGFQCIDSRGRYYVIAGLTTAFLVIGSGCERFDPATNTWSTIASLPVSAAFGCCAIDPTTDAIYYTQGQTTSGFSGFNTALYRYNQAANTWTTLAPCPVTNSLGGALVVGDWFYCLPGRSGTQGAELWAYQISTDTWCQGVDIFQPEHSDYQMQLLPNGSGSYWMKATASWDDTSGSSRALDLWSPSIDPCHAFTGRRFAQIIGD